MNIKLRLYAPRRAAWDPPLKQIEWRTFPAVVYPS